MNVGQMKKFLEGFDDDVIFFVSDHDHNYRRAYFHDTSVVHSTPYHSVPFYGEYAGDEYMEDGDKKVRGLVVE